MTDSFDVVIQLIGTECTIKCGKYCYDPAIKHEPPCLSWKKKVGCLLPREQRPDVCNMFLCEKAMQALKRREH